MLLQPHERPTISPTSQQSSRKNNGFGSPWSMLDVVEAGIKDGEMSQIHPRISLDQAIHKSVSAY